MLRRRDANRYDLERTFCVLRNERTLFHRVVSLGLLFAVDNTSATPTRTLQFPAGISSNSSSFESASKPIYGGSYGDGTVSWSRCTRTESGFANKPYRANKMDSRVPWILAVCSAPIMLFKQYVNFVQIYEASKWLAEGDLAERARLGLPKVKKVQ